MSKETPKCSNCIYYLERPDGNRCHRYPPQMKPGSDSESRFPLVYPTINTRKEPYMSIYETVGMAWVILTSLIATIAILYLAFVGLRTVTEQTRAQQIIHIGQDSRVADDILRIAGVQRIKERM